MNRSNLVPTVIVDKNNKTTTVHKRAEAAISAASVPPPVISSARVPSRAASLKRCKKVVANAGSYSFNEKLLALHYIEDMEAAPLANVTELLEQRTPAYSLFHTLGNFRDSLEGDEILEYTRLMKDHYYRLKDTIDQVEQASTIGSGFVRGFQKLKEVNPDITAEQGAAIMDTLAGIYCETMDNDGYPSVMWVSRDKVANEKVLFVMNSNELREHIMENPEESSRVVALFRNNPHIGEAELMHLLRNPEASPSLSDGAL